MADPSLPAPDDANAPKALWRWLEDAVHWVRGFIFGMTTYDMALTLHKERADREALFVLISFGDLIGVPILPPYYSLRLLPFIIPLMNTWKHRLLRERDLTDVAGMID